MNRKNELRALCEGAIMVTIAQILSYIKLWEMPWGGSVVLAMVPIILYAVRWGVGRGLLAGFVFGVLQFMFDGGFAIGWQSIVGDYLLAFTVLGLAGVMKGKKLGVFLGTLIAGVARCGGGNHLGRVHAGYLLWHDHDLSMDLFSAVQHGLHGAQYHHYTGGVCNPLQAHEEIPAGQGHSGIRAFRPGGICRRA